MDPIPAKQVKVEQPQPPCDKYVLFRLDHHNQWKIVDSTSMESAQESIDFYVRDHVPIRLFHLSDAPSAPLAVDAGVREGLAKLVEDACEEGESFGFMAKQIIAFIKKAGWGPKGEEKRRHQCNQCGHEHTDNRCDKCGYPGQ